jgi:hypothetical protein
VAGNDWQRSIYWVHQWWKYWRPVMANFLPGMANLLPVMANFLPGMANLPATGHHPMATGFLPKHRLYLLS